MKKEKLGMNANPFVAIGASLGGIFLVIVLIVLLTAPDYASILTSIVWAFAVMAIVLAHYASKKNKK